MPRHGTGGGHDRENCKNPDAQTTTRDTDNSVGATDEQKKPETSVGTLAYLRLVDIVQVPHPTGVKLASSRGERSCFLDTNTHGMVQFHL